MTPYYQDDLVTIYHADCRDEWIGFEIASAVLITDPPYGIAHSSSRGGKFLRTKVLGDLDTSLRDEVLAMWGYGPALVFGSWKAARPARTRHLLIWEKGDHVGMGALDLPWRPNTEEIYVLGEGFVGRRGSSVIRVNAPSPNFTPPQFRYHPTEKPVELMTALISKCRPGTIIDPFMGSGSTLRAAKDLGRKAIGIEVEERYCEIAAQRCSQEVLGLSA